MIKVIVIISSILKFDLNTHSHSFIFFLTIFINFGCLEIPFSTFINKSLKYLLCKLNNNIATFKSRKVEYL